MSYLILSLTTVRHGFVSAPLLLHELRPRLERLLRMQTPTPTPPTNLFTNSSSSRMDPGKAATQPTSSSVQPKDSSSTARSAFSGELRLHVEKALSTRLGRGTDKAAEAQRELCVS